MKNKTKILIICIIMVSFISITILNYILKTSYKNNSMKSSIKQVGNLFYKNYLYKEHYDMLVKTAESNGKISFSIYHILKSTEKIYNEIKENDFYSKCDIINSSIDFIPHIPVTDSNVDIIVELKCKD